MTQVLIISWRTRQSWRQSWNIFFIFGLQSAFRRIFLQSSNVSMSALLSIRWISIKKVLRPVLIWIISIYPFFRSLPSISTARVLLVRIVPAHLSKDSISNISNDYLGRSSLSKLIKLSMSYSSGYKSLYLQSHTDLTPLTYSNFQFLILYWEVINCSMGKFKNRNPSSIRMGLRGFVMFALFILNYWPINL